MIQLERRWISPWKLSKYHWKYPWKVLEFFLETRTHNGVDYSPGALSIEQDDQSTGDNMPWPTGDTQFPWSTMRVDSFPGALYIEQYDVHWW